MKKFLLLIVVLLFAVLSFSCVSMPSTTERTLTLGGVTYEEADFGDIGRWYATDTYSSDLVDKVYFQVVWVKNGKNLGYILYGDGTTGELAHFSIDGLNLRWDWGPSFQYAITITPDGYGLYYDFTGSEGKLIKPRSRYKMVKF